MFTNLYIDGLATNPNDYFKHIPNLFPTQSQDINDQVF